MDTDSFVIHVKTNDFFHDISNDVNLWFDTSNYITKLPRPLPIGKNKKVLGKFKDELGGKIISELCCLKAKTYSYKLDDDSECKKAKGTKKCIVKRHIIFDNYLDTLFKTTKLLKTQYTFKSDHHTLYTQKLNKIALNFFDDKRIQCNDKITTYPYGYFDNTSNINDEIKNNTKEPNKSDNSGIIPKNFNTKDPLEKDINKNTIINNNADIHADSATSTCINIIKSIDAFTDITNSMSIDIIKNTYAYIDKIKSIYADNAKSTCIDKIKNTNVNNNYIDCIKSTCIDKTKSNKVNIIYANSAKSTCIDKINIIYGDSAKSTCIDKTKSTNVNNNYLNSTKSTCPDNVNINKVKNNIIRVHSKSTHELIMLLKIKKVTNKAIIFIRKINKQAASIKYELNALNKL